MAGGPWIRRSDIATVRNVGEGRAWRDKTVFDAGQLVKRSNFTNWPDTKRGLSNEDWHAEILIRLVAAKHDRVVACEAR